MKLYIKRSVAFLMCALFVFTLFGCEKKHETRNILYETEDPIKTLDPQLAVSDTEQQAVMNLFEGLMRYDKDGKIECAAAKSYTVSSNKKVYSFTLRDHLTWSNGRPLTAEDFVFGLKRAVDPETNAPYAATLTPIKNAQKIIAGNLGTEKLGVKAVSEKVLEITLSEPTEDFLKILASSVAMPCSKAFFTDTKGYYGLKNRAVLSNGAYSLKAWNEEYCALMPNENYHSFKKTTNPVYIYFNKSDDLFENLKKGEPDLSTLNTAMLTRIKNETLDGSLQHISTGTTSLLFNKNAKIANSKILSALRATAKVTLSKEDTDYYGYSAAESMLPGIINAYKDLKVQKRELSAKSAQEAFKEGCTELQVERIFPSFTLYYVDNDITKRLAQQIASGWQSGFGVTVNIKSCEDEDALWDTVAAGNYDVALVESHARSDDAAEFLQQFTKNSTLNRYGFQSGTFDSLYKSLLKLTDKSSRKTVQEMLKLLAEDDYLLPMYHTSKTYYLTDRSKDAINQKNMILDFSKIQ